MRLGITADLHYGIDPVVDRRIATFLERVVGPAELDTLLIAGDLAEMSELAGAELGSRHRALLADLRAAAGCPVAFCAGNHDIWCTDPASDSWRIYEDVLTAAAAVTGTTYLDRESLRLGDVAIVGCYGHFDYSLRTPGLVIAGEEVTDDHYRRQTPPGYPGPVWMDRRMIRWPWTDAQACARICDAAESRLQAALAGAGRVVFVSHGVPRRELNGHCLNRDPVSQFLNAFSGTARLEALIRGAAGREARVLSVSGHTHKRIARLTLEEIDYLNVGGNYGAPRLAVETF
jgi:3',5'-cyclic AMP phosphodiesterase CpdA